MKRIRELEGVVLRGEAAVMVALVAVMLALAAYNVAYRNLLVPLQRHYATSGPPIVVEPVAPSSDASGHSEEPAGAEGFGGGFGEGGKEGEGAEGFGGGLGEGGNEGAGAEGFGGGFGEEGGAGEKKTDDLAAAPEPDEPPSEPLGGPPPAGSAAASIVAIVDAMKIDWIDVFLRQLVIIVSFLGATLATQRGKHINVDALSKTLPASLGRVMSVIVSLLAVVVCVTLAVAGWDLVQIGREFPKDLLPWADEWQLQLAFPVGFGLLAFHFAVRLLEAATAPPARGGAR